MKVLARRDARAAPFDGPVFSITCQAAFPSDGGVCSRHKLFYFDGVDDYANGGNTACTLWAGRLIAHVAPDDAAALFEAVNVSG